MLSRAGVRSPGDAIILEKVYWSDEKFVIEQDEVALEVPLPQ